jgi:hypothetical protein
MSEDRRCTAMKSNRSGRCANSAMKFQTTCRNHGGLAPQSLAKARERMAEAADPIAAKLVRTALDEGTACPHCGRGPDQAVATRAGFGLLDRVGIGEISTLRVERTNVAAEPADVRTLIARSLGNVLQALDLGDAVAYLLPEERQALETILTAVKGRIDADALTQQARRALAEAHEIPTTEPGQGYD